MKRMITALLAAILLAACAAAPGAGEGIPGAADMPAAGMRFTPPEAFRNTNGIILTEGAERITGDISYAYWLYCAMTAEELDSLYADPDSAAGADITMLFYLFSAGKGKGAAEISRLFASPVPEENIREIGRAGDWTFFLLMAEPDRGFAERIGAEYAGEYARLAGLADEVAAAVTCFEPVPPKALFTSKDLDGNEISAADLFAQHEVTMVNIWATWCPPCVGELAELQKLHLRMQEKDCGVIGMLDDTNLDEARRLAAENGVEYPVILAPEHFTEIFPIEAYPTSYFVGRDGTILGTPVVGAYPDRYEPMLDSLLQQP